MANPTDDPPIPQPGRDSLPDAQARLADYRALPCSSATTGPSCPPTCGRLSGQDRAPDLAVNRGRLREREGQIRVRSSGTAHRERHEARGRRLEIFHTVNRGYVPGV